MRELELSGGNSCLVDDDDYDFLNQFKWWCSDNGDGYKCARRTHPAAGKPDIRMHRMLTAAMPGDMVDHKDGNSLNNQRSNLRLCTRSQNTANSKPQESKKYSNYRGVSVVKDRTKTRQYWTAQARKDGVLHHVGCFPTEEDAALAYDKKAVELHGEFAKINFPQLLPQAAR